MENSTWLLGPLLWEAARYGRQFGAGEAKKLFSLLYADEARLKPFSQAIEQGETNNASQLMHTALALAQGLSPKNDVATNPAAEAESPSIPALASVLSRVRLQPEASIKTFYHTLPKTAFTADFAEAPTVSRQALESHLNAFTAEMQFLKSANSHRKIDTVLALLEKYFYCLPVLDAPPNTDVPLFCIAKFATAIVSCWEKSAGELPTAPDLNTPAYTLIQGDLSGIQKYIYRLQSAKGAAKGLKGRSFELSLLTDVVAKYLLLKFNLSSANIIYSSGGKFFVLAPQRAQNAIDSLRTTLERECHEKFDGEIFMGLAGVPITGNDFQAERFGEKWKEVNDACNATKQRKFATLISADFDAVFEPKGSGKEKPTCDACGWEDLNENALKVRDEDTDKERWLCPRCVEMERRGSQLSRAKYLVEVVNEQNNVPQGDFVRLEPLHLGDDYRLTYYIVPQDQPPQFNGEQVTYFSFELQAFDQKHPLADRLELSPVQFGFRFYGGNDMPRDEKEEPLEYDDLAKASDGLKRLGVLRMDVDNLGRLFQIGLGKNAAPARVMALSWQINYFFSYRLNQLRDEGQFNQHVLIVYSGGDDLFIVGSWDRVVEFAVKIRDKFAEFTHNPQLSISGGLAIVPRKFPIHKAADFSGEAEAAAKQIDGGAKNAFTMLDKPLGWSDFDLANSIRQELQAAIEPAPNENGETSSDLNKGIIDRLRRIYGLYDENRRRKSKWPRATPAQMENYLDALRYDKWRWMLTYSLSRYLRNNPKHEGLIKRLQEALINNKWVDQNGKAYRNKQDVISFIDVPTRWVEFLTREEPEPTAQEKKS